MLWRGCEWCWGREGGCIVWLFLGVYICIGVVASALIERYRPCYPVIACLKKKKKEKKRKDPITPQKTRTSNS